MNEIVLTSANLSTLGNPNLLPAFLSRYAKHLTKQAYAGDLKGFFGTSEVTVEQVRNVSFLHVNQFILDLERSGTRPATIKRKVTALRAFFDWALALGILERNPAHRLLIRRVATARREDRAIIVLTDEEARRLIAAARTERDALLIRTLIYAALRRSEAAAMNIEDLQHIGPYPILNLPHTKGGENQYVKLPVNIYVDILAFVQPRTEGPVWTSLSTNHKGGRLHPFSIYRIVNETARRAGLGDRIGAHTMRHTGCTLAIEGGASIQQVQSHARHKSLETTMAYVHQRDRLKDSAVDHIKI
jgi:integrase